MIQTDNCFLDMVIAPVREIRGRVELYNGSTLIDIYKYTDNLKEFSIERVGNKDKFFGYGICQRLNTKLIDKDREIDITTANTLEISFGVGCDYMYAFPFFNVSEVHRNEDTNELSITAYDALYKASSISISSLDLPTEYTLEYLARLCATALNCPFKLENVTDSVFTTLYANNVNFSGTETLREVLDYIAEVTQTIYFINSQWELCFKRLDIAGAPVFEIDKQRYFTLDSSTNRRLTKIVHATELGDNVGAELTEAGTTQYIRNNPLWDLREDIGILVDNALLAVGGLTINQFECEWRGNFLLEIGDKIALVTKDDATVISYVLDSVITYNGTLVENTQWKYEDNDTETESNPSSLGESLKQTFARVDKANKQIELLVSDSEASKEELSTLQLNTDSINATVKQIETNVNNELSGINGSIETLTNQISATMTAEQVKLEIATELSNGVDKVTTSTGFTFNDDGLTVSKSDSEMSTQITEDGMQVFKNDDAVLTANNIGVNAVNLHATTYLIIGTNSRFEDFGTNRTGCFYIGGSE